MSIKTAIAALRTNIIRMAKEGRALRNEANELSGPGRHDKHVEALYIGVHARWALLTYGLLRGLKYKRIEATTRTPDYVIRSGVTCQLWELFKIDQKTAHTLATDWILGDDIDLSILEPPEEVEAEASVKGAA